jgi:FkbM family methyltransferase
MIISKLKAIKQNLEINLFPLAYKKKYFERIDSLNWKNIKNRNIENELLLIQYFLDSDSTFIDVGANLGQYIFKAEGIIPRSNIFAFEPHPALNKRLSKLFSGIRLSQDALSDTEGNTQFKIPYFNNREIHTRGTLKTEHIEIDETNSVLIDVHISTLNKFSETSKIEKISLVKIDVEGAEFDVIKGANEMVEKFHPVFIIEIEQRHHKTSILDFIMNLEKTGQYTCCYFDTIDQQLKTDIKDKKIEDIQSLDNHGKNRLFINNFIFIPAMIAEIKIDEINTKIRKAVN